MKAAKIQTLKIEFEFLSMKDTDLLKDFYMKLNGIMTNIRALGEDMKESYIVKKILRTVPPKFLQIASFMEQLRDLEAMMVEEAVGALKAHEERIKGNKENNGGQLLMTEEDWIKKEGGENKLLITKERVAKMYD